MASQKAKADAIDQIEAFAKLGGSVNLRVTRDGDSVQWMAQVGSADGRHAITDMAMDFTDLVASMFAKIEAQTSVR